MTLTEDHSSPHLAPVVAVIFEIDAAVRAIRCSRSNRDLAEVPRRLIEVERRLAEVDLTSNHFSPPLADNYRSRLLTLRFEMSRVRSFLDAERSRVLRSLQ